MSININLDNRFIITSDQYQFILQEKKNAKSGKNAGKQWLDTVGYYPKLSQLISGLIHHDIRSASINSLEEMEKHVERLSMMCEKSFGATTND